METGDDKPEGSTTLRNFGLLDNFLSDPNRKAMCENDENCETTTESMPPNVPIHYICPTTSLGASTQSPKSSQFVILQSAQTVTPTVYQTHSEIREQSVPAASLTAWKHEDEVQLIKLRMQFNYHFLGDKCTTKEGWEKISMNMGYGATQCRKKWEGMLKKYKTLKVACETALEGSETIITWRAYEPMDGYLGEIIHDVRIEGDPSQTGKISSTNLSELIRQKQQDDPRCIPKVATVTSGNKVLGKQSQKRLLQSQRDSEETPYKVCVHQKSKRMMELQARRKPEQPPSTVSSQDHCAEMMAFLRETTERERRDRNRILNIIENILSATTVENNNVDNT